MNYIILISTPDSRGLVHKISSNLLDFNIEKNDEFVDKENEYFFMRTEISVEGNSTNINSSLGEGNSPLELHSADFGIFGASQTPSLVSAPKIPKNYESQTENPSVVDSLHESKDKKTPSLRGRIVDSHEAIQKNQIDCHDSAFAESCNDESSVDSTQSAIESRLRAILPPQSFIKVTQKRKKSIVIFCTKEAHCLGDLLMKHYNNELDIDIKAVISNYESLQSLVEKFHIPYFYISHNGADYENAMLEVCARFAPDFIVLAKYMRILSPHFIAHYENRIINIHHSFLPAFIGANPYKQAYTRGVKIIGATAHFVTSELDSGPIICQDIMQVNHTLSWRDMQKAGKNIERVVLARAVELAIDERIFIHKNKTIIF